jgi:hypothetical protein
VQCRCACACTLRTHRQCASASALCVCIGVGADAWAPRARTGDHVICIADDRCEPPESRLNASVLIRRCEPMCGARRPKPANGPSIRRFLRTRSKQGCIDEPNRVGTIDRALRSTSVHIGPHRFTSVHIGPHRSASVHIGPHRSTSVRMPRGAPSGCRGICEADEHTNTAESPEDWCGPPVPIRASIN